ncbi:LysR family transcriptional regulator [Marinobacter litoralis]|uniref:LysR family transcriptional regulator n=1 Tax=Marinobacter litoralis TaxID=187981 RepID=UPI0018ED0168|nr:LysR substrate-binding domain-containing protein [Marinobacter litoralis]MBJ6136834.1 LysR family transcriptional regulator [Marinobacter litoralis]
MLPELKIQQLRYVIAVVDEGGFNAAAKRVFRSQPALSMAVRELEQRLGQNIFERGGKGQLTPFGKFCLPRFRELLGQHGRLVKDLVNQADGKQGHVHIATVPSVATRIMPPLLAEFIDQFPNLTISLHDENAHYVCQMVAHGEVDLGITSLWQGEDELDYTHLFEDKVGVVCHRSHPLANRSSIDWRSLQGEKLIRNGTSRLLMGTEASALVENSAFYISNMISLIAMLEAGAGITTLPQLAFPENNQNLSFIPLQEPDVVRRIGLVKASNCTLSPAAQIMDAFLLKSLRGGEK